MSVVWRRAAKSYQNGACVEVGACPHGVLIRDSKDPHGPVLTFTQEEWEAFKAGVLTGDFDELLTTIITTLDLAAALESSGDPEGAAVVRAGERDGPIEQMSTTDREGDKR